MKTPDEIKKGLECCSNGVFGKCTECPYNGKAFPGCALSLVKEGFFLLNRLDAACTEAESRSAALYDRVEQLEAERDAAVESMRSDPHCCYHCANMTKRGICQSEPRADGHCFEWRGVQKGE